MGPGAFSGRAGNYSRKRSNARTAEPASPLSRPYAQQCRGAPREAVIESAVSTADGRHDTLHRLLMVAATLLRSVPSRQLATLAGLGMVLSLGCDTESNIARHRQLMNSFRDDGATKAASALLVAVIERRLDDAAPMLSPELRTEATRSKLEHDLADLPDSIDPELELIGQHKFSSGDHDSFDLTFQAKAENRYLIGTARVEAQSRQVVRYWLPRRPDRGRPSGPPRILIQESVDRSLVGPFVRAVRADALRGLRGVVSANAHSKTKVVVDAVCVHRDRRGRPELDDGTGGLLALAGPVARRKCCAIEPL